MKAKAVLSSAGIAKATVERWQRASYRYNRMHFPISGDAIYHDINGDKLLTQGNVYLLVNSSALNFELIENEEYYHMYIDFRTVPPLLNRDVLEIKLDNDHYLTYLIKAIQNLVKESIDAAWFFFLDNAQKVCHLDRVLDKDYSVYYGDQQGRYISPEISVAEFAGLCSCAFNKSVLPSMAVVGELTLSGSIKEVKNISEYVRVAINAGALQLLMPISCQSEFDAIKDSELRRINPVYYRTPVEAARLALGL
jgi:hypothetical protein